MTHCGIYEILGTLYLTIQELIWGTFISGLLSCFISKEEDCVTYSICIVKEGQNFALGFSPTNVDFLPALQKIVFCATFERYKWCVLSVFLHKTRKGESSQEVFSPGCRRHIKTNDGNISLATGLLLLRFYAPGEITLSVAAENDY